MAGVEAAIRDVLSPLLIGCDPLQYRRLHVEMLSRTFGNSLAVGGVDIALHDLRARILGVPVYALYGGARDRKSTRLNSSHVEISPLSLHDALPIYGRSGSRHPRRTQSTPDRMRPAPVPTATRGNAFEDIRQQPCRWRRRHRAA